MGSKPASEVRKALLAKGMVTYDSHHEMFTLDVDGVTTVITRISRSHKVIGDDLLARMGKQCFLQLKEFRDLVDCPLSAKAWVRLIKEREVGGRNPFIS